MAEKPVTKTLVVDADRPDFLVKHMGKYFLKYEMMVFDLMTKMCQEYHGGYWNYYELSNGGFYMAFHHDGLLHMHCDTNGYEGEMGADAASICINLFALNYLTNSTLDEGVNVKYYQLLDYLWLSSHPEAPKIGAFID